MSPIGRVFVVLNLVLAGAFVGFAGTFLKNHTDYKAKFTAKSSELEKSTADWTKERESLNGLLGTSNRELTAANSNFARSEAELKEEKNRNETLSKQVADLIASVNQIKSDNATVASKVEAASEDAKKTLQMAMAADEEKHKALNAQQAAEAKLAEASNKITAMDADIANLKGEIAKKDTMIQERDTLIALVKHKSPGILTLAQPDAEGRVHHSAEKLVTIELTKPNPELKAGNTFSIYNGNAYKGEAVITDIKDNFAFCRMTMVKDAIAVGDRAATNLGR